VEATRTWEFNSTFPIRSYAVPYIYLKIPLIVFKMFFVYSKYYLGEDLRTTYTLIVLPRLIMCLISFVNDWSIYKICKLYNLKYDVRLLALASSFVTLTFGIRTFSNTIEMALCSVLLYLVSECMVNSNTVIYQKEFLEDRYQKAEKITDKVKYFKIKQALPHHSLNKCAIISNLCVFGVFNRPTFIVFGMPMVFFWLLRGMGSRSVSFVDFNLRMLVFIISGIPSLLFIIFVDSLYYGFITAAEIYQLEVGLHNFVVTPLNFVRYNIDPENTANHGVHPKYLHVLVNIPLLFNILGVVALFSFGNMFVK
jgi:phosphatidylinositol glycan class Z